MVVPFSELFSTQTEPPWRSAISHTSESPRIPATRTAPSMPPYGVRRGYGGKRRSVRADIQSAPTGAPAVGFYCRGALHMRPCRAAGTAGLAVHGARSWRHVGMPPYGVRRGRGGNRGSVRAAHSRPYGACSTRSVGRGAHTPPNQAAGITGLAVHETRPWRHVGMPPYGVRRGAAGSSENAAAHGREAAFQRGFVQSGLIRAADAYG